MTGWCTARSTRSTRACHAWTRCRAAAGVPVGETPRKSQPAYARVMAAVLQAAAGMEAPNAPLKRLIFIGDTRMNDSTAYANLCAAGDWPGMACIISETGAAPELKAAESVPAPGLYLANRWNLLAEFDELRRRAGFPLDERTVVVFDIDKTALGARGRNAGVIDQARVAAVRTTVEAMLGPAFNSELFNQAYNTLKEPEYHPFTADNQDYLAYICLILGSGLYSLETVLQQVQAGELTGFRQFIARVDEQQAELPPALQSIHTAIYANVQAGDPTPFKAFRRNEYLATVGRMGHLPDDTPVGELLAQEIVLTQEVRTLANAWRREGALLFGLSDKPDEASLPTPEQAAQGFLPLHRQPTHAVGMPE